MILVKTDAGQQALKDRSVRLTPRQRSAFILCDGRRSINDVLAAGMGISQQDLDYLVDLGLLALLNGMDAPAMVRIASEPGAAAIRPTPTHSPSPAFSFAPVAVHTVSADQVQLAPGRSGQQRYQDAYPIATRLTGSLGLRGFRLNLSVEGTSTYDELLALAPKIRAAVGADKAAELDRALEGSYRPT